MASNCPKLLRRVLQKNSNIPFDLVQRKKKLKNIDASFRMLKTLLLQQEDITLELAKLISELCHQMCIDNKLDVNMDILKEQFNDFNLEDENESNVESEINVVSLESYNMHLENPTQFVEKAIYCFKTIMQKLPNEKIQDDFLERILLLVFHNI